MGFILWHSALLVGSMAIAFVALFLFIGDFPETLPDLLLGCQN